MWRHMRTHIVLAIVVALVAPLLAQSPQRQSPQSGSAVVGSQPVQTAFEQSLLEAEKNFMSADDRGDVQYVDTTLAADFFSVGSNGGTDPRSEFLNGVRETKFEPAKKNEV